MKNGNEKTQDSYKKGPYIQHCQHYYNNKKRTTKAAGQFC